MTFMSWDCTPTKHVEALWDSSKLGCQWIHHVLIVVKMHVYGVYGCQLGPTPGTHVCEIAQ